MDYYIKDERKNKGTGVKFEMSFYHINGDFMQDVMRNLTLRLLMSYIYGAHILDVSRLHTTTHHSR